MCFWGACPFFGLQRSVNTVQHDDCISVSMARRAVSVCLLRSFFAIFFSLARYIDTSSRWFLPLPFPGLDSCANWLSAGRLLSTTYPQLCWANGFSVSCHIPITIDRRSVGRDVHVHFSFPFSIEARAVELGRIQI